jgi:Domain of unknown function (DUF4440)
MKKIESMEKSRDEIFNIIKNINRTWLEGRTEDLRRFFHNDIITISPDYKNRLEGIDNVIKSYKDFFENSKTYEFEESDFHIELFDKTATADYLYQITYEINHKKYTGNGREVWVFSKTDKWQGVWRFIFNISEKEIN